MGRMVRHTIQDDVVRARWNVGTEISLNRQARLLKSTLGIDAENEPDCTWASVVLLFYDRRHRRMDTLI